jgi:hypothetical protein
MRCINGGQVQFADAITSFSTIVLLSWRRLALWRTAFAPSTRSASTTTVQISTWLAETAIRHGYTLASAKQSNVPLDTDLMGLTAEQRRNAKKKERRKQRAANEARGGDMSAKEHKMPGPGGRCAATSSHHGERLNQRSWRISAQGARVCTDCPAPESCGRKGAGRAVQADSMLHQESSISLQ